MTELVLEQFDYTAQRDPPSRRAVLARFTGAHFSGAGAVEYFVVSNIGRTRHWVYAVQGYRRASNTKETTVRRIGDQWIELVRAGKVRIEPARRLA